MKYLQFLPLIFILIFPVLGNAQVFNTDQQYQQAMKNAKQAFEAKQYSEAVLFYREAMKIKPDALLPKYKIEDIRTIYIEKELKSEPQPAETPKQARLNKKKRKELEAEQQRITEKAREEATRKMNADADKALKEIREVNVKVVDINEPVEDTDMGKNENVGDIAGDKETMVQKVESRDQEQLSGGIQPDKSQSLTLEIRDLPEVKQPPVDTMDLPKKPKPVEEKSVTQVNKAPISVPPVKKPPKMTPEQKEQWVKTEQKRLNETYPNKKTVEEIDKPGKDITRVIMNIVNHVTIYLKVKHSWGATFFFIDETGQELKSINEQYFNLMTKLETYGG